MSILVGQSSIQDPHEAVADLRRQIQQPQCALVVFFCSSHYDLQGLSGEIQSQFADIPVVGCTSAGEIGPAGCLSGSLVGISFSSRDFSCRIIPQDDLRAIDSAALLFAINDLKPQAEVFPNQFSLLLIDGLSGSEEIVARGIQMQLGTIPLIGGSAGDDQRFLASQVYWNGHFRNNRAVLVLISTCLPVKPFRTQHFSAIGAPLVVTEADAEHRIIKTINGRPALREFSAAIGIAADILIQDHFTASPLVVRINGADFVRSIREAGADDSLTLYCAIDRGVVLRTARKVDLYQNRLSALQGLGQEVGPIQAIIGFDCILCRIEAEKNGQLSQLADLYREHKVIGFNTYGEQFHGLHMNQTMTGIAIGTRRPS